MGFISKIFGAIFSFIGSLFSSIGKVFGLGGKSDYFIELDNSKSASAPPSQPAQPASAQEQAPKATEPSAAAKTETAAEPKAAPAPEAKPQPAPASASHANGSASMNNGKVIPGMTFAPDMMLPVSTDGGRRRPGPSLSPFKEMARNMQR